MQLEIGVKHFHSNWGAFGITVNNVLPGFTETERLNEIIEIKQKKPNVSFKEMENALDIYPC